MADQPVAALIKDLKQRGLLDSDAGAVGRRVRPHAAGREPQRLRRTSTRPRPPSVRLHVWMAGGGIKGGQIYGKTDDIGWNVVEDPVHVNDLHATILHQFGFDHRRLTVPFQGRVRLTDEGGKVVSDLLA